MEKKTVFAPNAPKPVGAYTHGIIVNGLYFSAGQIALDPKTNEMVTDDIEKETRRVMENMKALLEAAGTSYDNLVKATLYITDLNDFTKIDNVYKEYVTKDFPGRTCVQVSGIPKGGHIEIEVVATV